MCNKLFDNFFFFFALFILPIFPVQGHGGCLLVNRETLLELRSELRSYVLPATTIDFFWDSNPQLTARKSCILTIKWQPLPISFMIISVVYGGGSLDTVLFISIRIRDCLRIAKSVYSHTVVNQVYKVMRFIVEEAGLFTLYLCSSYFIQCLCQILWWWVRYLFVTSYGIAWSTMSLALANSETTYSPS